MRTKHWKRALWDSFLGMLRSQLFATGGGMEGQIVPRSSLAVTNIVSVIESCKSNFILCFPQLAGSTHVTTPTDFLASLRELAGWIYCEGTSWQHLRAMQTFLFFLITIFLYIHSIQPVTGIIYSTDACTKCNATFSFAQFGSFKLRLRLNIGRRVLKGR